MKKILVLSVLLGVGLMCGVAQAQDLTINDGFYTYDLYFAANITMPLGTTGPIALYGLTVRTFPPAFGWATYQANWNAFKLIVLEDNDYWGWTIEGHWGVEAYHCNNAGFCGDPVTVSIGALKPTDQAPGKDTRKK